MGGIKITPMPNPMTTGADIVYAAAGGVPTRLANGTAGQFLKSNGTTVAPSWATLFTNWTSYSPTFTNLTEGNGTKRFYYRRVGDSIHLKGVFIFGSTSSVGGTIKFTLPSGLTIDTSKTVGNSSGQSFYEYVGIATYYHGGVGAHYTMFQDSNSTNTFYIDGASGVWNATVPVTWTTASEIHITEFSIPISEWAL